jgi:hypothetical protein
MAETRLKPGLITLWGVLAAVVIVIIFGSDLAERPEQAPPEPRALLGFGEPDLGSVEVLNLDRRAALKRDETGNWFLHDATHKHQAGEQVATSESHQATPETAIASEAVARVAASLSAANIIEARRPLEEYGLANPGIIVAYYGRDGVEVDTRRPLAMLYIGGEAPDGETYFATIGDEPGIVLVPRGMVDRLLEMMFPPVMADES